MTMRIRAASAEDAADIAKVQVLAWRAAYRGVLPSDYLDSIDVRERTRVWQAMLHQQQPEGTTLVAESEAGVFGFARASSTRDDDQDARAVGWTADGTAKRDVVGGVPVTELRYRRVLV